MTYPKKSKILIADDNDISVAYLGIFLKKMGFDSMPAQNGLDVLRLLQIERPDAMLIDVGMEPMDGIEVLKHVKEKEQFASIPVIMVSGDESAETIEKCRENGSAGYLKKPVSIAELHKALEGCFFARRRHCRVSVHKEVIVVHENKPYILITETLSEGGLYIKKKEPFPLGAEVQVTLPFLDNGSLSLQGTVVYTKSPMEGEPDMSSGMGIQFRECPDDASKTLKEYIETMISDGVRIV